MIRQRFKDAIIKSFFVNRLARSRTDSIVLTFDDGPHPVITQQVLDLLSEYDARAVFFIVGSRIHTAPHVLKRILELGHIIGNHTYLHSNNTQPRFLEYQRDLVKCQSLIEEYSGQKPTLFRPPGGRISLSSLLIPRLLKLETVLWSLDSQDWASYNDNNASQISEHLLGRLVPGDIVLLHDDNPNTPPVLERILPSIRNRKLDLWHGVDHLRAG